MILIVANFFKNHLRVPKTQEHSSNISDSPVCKGRKKIKKKKHNKKPGSNERNARCCVCATCASDLLYCMLNMSPATTVYVQLRYTRVDNGTTILLDV